MKKIVVLILCVLLCFSLVACGNGMEEEKFADGDGSVCSVVVTINPKYEIFVSQTGTITLVEYLNQDAKTVFAKVDVTQMDFETGFRRLLDAAYEQGYMEGNSVPISIAVYRIADAAVTEEFVVDAMTRATEEFSRNTGVGLAVSRQDTVVIGQPTSQTQAEWETVPESDEQIQMEEETQAGGSYIAEGTLDDGTFKEYYEDGILVKRETFLADGTQIEEFFSETGNMTREVREQADGSHSDVVFDQKGNPIEVLSVDASGAQEKAQREFDGNGNMLHEIKTLADGSQSERTLTYHGNGNIKTDLRTGGDVVRAERHYAEDGTMLYNLDVKPNGEENEARYAEDGTTLFTYYKAQSGDYTKSTYSDSGVLVTRESSHNGDISVMSYRADGTASHEYVYCADGTIWYNVFDANGKQILEAQKQIQ